MRNLIIIGAFFLCLNIHCQFQEVKGTLYDELTQAQLDALPNRAKRNSGIYYNTTTGQHVKWNGTAFVPIGEENTNDFITSVSETAGVITFNIPNQSNPTLSLNSINLSAFNNDLPPSGTGDFLADGSIGMTGAFDLNLQNLINGGTGSFSLMNANLMAVGSGTGNPRMRFQTSPGFYIDLEGTASSLSYGGVDLLSPISSSVISQHTPVNYANTTSGTTLTGSLSGIDEVLGNLGKLVYTSSSGNRTLLPGDIISTAFPNRGRRVSIIIDDNSTITIDDTLPVGVPFVLGSGDLAEKLTIEFSGAIVYGEGVELVKATESVNKITVESGRTIVISKESSGNYRADGMWEVFQSALDLPSLVVKQTPETIDPTAVNEGDVVSVWNDSQSGFNATAATTTRGTLHIENGERQILFDGVDDFYTYGNVPQLDFTPGTDEFTIVLKIGHAVSQTKTQQLIAKAQLNSTSSGQYSISLISSTQRYYAGGLQSIESTAFAAGDVIVMVVRTTGMDVYRNDVLIVDNEPVGTATTSNDLLLGARFDGSSHNYEGSFSHIAIFNDAISRSEITEIFNEITQ
ncbi:hypothetical protein [Spongiimicrobium salis]|uniref:hypothetical protein n=1 Tax=Spongiimicrobium salis TaxID=1667022 RepID=UPI00374D8342